MMKPYLRHLFHYGAYLLAAVVILVSASALALRFLIIPEIDRYKAYIESSASDAVGVPVSIGAIEADWWWLNPRFSLRDVALSSPGREAPLRLGQVDATISWLSLAWQEPHLTRLDIVRPSLEIRRDNAGVIYVAGIPVNVPSAPSPFPDWLLRQRAVTVSGGRLTWLDETLEAPPLVLNQVNIRLENRFRRHRFGLTAQPPADAGTLLDLRGDLRGESVHRLASWSGRLYARADGASAAALHAWAPWAQASVKRSVGDLRCWLTLAQGRIQALTGDVKLHDVAVSLAADRPDMVFRQVSGRIGWQRGKADHVFFVDRLRAITAAGDVAEPANVRVVVKPDPAGKPQEASLAVDNLRLETLTALSGAVPMPRQGHDWVAAFNPHGYIEHAEVNWLGKTNYRLSARFRDVGLNASEKLPGITGLSGEVVVDPTRGEISLDTGRMRFDYDRVFRQPLEFDRVTARLDWRADGRGGYRVELDQAAVANADLHGEANGSLVWKPGTAPVIDLRGNLSRGRGDAVWRYLPRQAGDDAYEWVRHSVLAGTSPDTRLVLKGPMDRFPFDKGGGEFRVDVQMRDAVLSYAPGWPTITAINGLLTFKDKSMSVLVDSAESSGARLRRVQATIPDLHYSWEETLYVDGQAVGPTPAFLNFIRQSPVFDHTERFTEEMRASGDGHLELHLSLPLRHIQDSSAAGRFSLNDNSVVLGGDFPDLEGVSGSIDFTNTTLRGTDIAARLYGQAVKINLANEGGGRLRAQVRGSLAAGTLARWLPADIAPRVSGSTPFQAEVSLRQRKANLSMNSTLVGLAIDLPAPIGKPASQTVSTSLTLRDGSGGDGHLLSVRYGEVLTANLAQSPEGEKRAAIQFGGPNPTLPKSKGLVLRGNLQSFDLDAWQSIEFGKKGAGRDEFPLRDLNLTFNQLIAMNRRLRDINVQATPLEPGWRIRLAGQDVQGDLEYTPRTSLPGNRLLGYFRKLAIPEEHKPGVRTDMARMGELPGEVDITAKSLHIQGHELGELKLKCSQERQGLRINTLSLRNPDGRLEGGGWLSVSPLRTTEVNLRLETADLGRLLRRLDYPEDVHGGETVVYGTLGWMGGVGEFRLDRLNGKLKAEIQNGRFTQLDPGAGRLLTMLSLQALPKRVVLDFRDVFSEGYLFDEIQGDVFLERGIGYLPDLHISGPSARIRMNGQIDLVRETQVLRLNIQPRLDESVAMAGALLGGPAVGVGALVASKLLKDPIAKAASFDYLVTGGWGDPVVRKLSRSAPDSAAAAP